MGHFAGCFFYYFYQHLTPNGVSRRDYMLVTELLRPEYFAP